MKSCSFLVLILLICTALPVSVMAEEPAETVQSPVEVITEETAQGVTVNVNLPTASESAGSPETEPAESLAVSTYSVSTLNEPEFHASAETEQQTMKDVVVMVLGDYSPKTQTVTQYLSDGSAETYTEIIPGVAGMDWEWISGAALFSMVLLSFLKLVGVLLKNG